MQKYLLALISWMIFLSSASASSAPWSGKWHVFWQQGAFVLELQQHGNEVNGTHQPNNGILKGTVEGKRLKGISINKQITNGFEFILSHDENAFFGNMDSGDWVAGERVKAQVTQKKRSLDTSHPFTTMYVFLKLGNQVRNGDYEVLAKAINLLSLSPVQQNYYYGKRMMLIRKYFQMLDLCTVQKYNFPSHIEGNLTTVTFHQAGTDNTVKVTFVKENAADGWKIKLPTEEEIDAKLKVLLHAYGLEELDPNRNLQLTNPRDTLRTFIEQNERWE